MDDTRFVKIIKEMEKAGIKDEDMPSVMASSKMPTMDPTVEKVLEFHRAFACHVEESPRIPCITGSGNEALKLAAHHLMKAREILREHGKDDVRCSRVALISEETAELASAFVEHDLVKVFDAFLDIGYVVAGGVTNCGLQNVYTEGMERVHASNMSKLDEDGNPIHDSAGKVVKGPNYRPVDLTDLVQGIAPGNTIRPGIEPEE